MVAHFMVQTQGENRNSHITGRSVHNQRIEHLWRDVYENVLDLYHTIFIQMEAEAWNNHGLRTSSHHTPLQLWLLNDKEGHDFSEAGDDYGIDWEGPHTPSTSNIFS
ncbi:hypothetical protein ATANTOWER_024211 [Ataeniobius toweri]|uniref:Integrase core domain-containing protein n=1 Tax=Ataeniobius toweri TaxID=208326 RepID=A0ABU7A912_9TELE|nr:hypothetical protein [Ataeniobius toweri]